jgi:hypothetical protein
LEYAKAISNSKMCEHCELFKKYQAAERRREFQQICSHPYESVRTASAHAVERTSLHFRLKRRMPRNLASTRTKTWSLDFVRNAGVGLPYRGVGIRNSGETCELVSPGWDLGGEEQSSGGMLVSGRENNTRFYQQTWCTSQCIGWQIKQWRMIKNFELDNSIIFSTLRNHSCLFDRILFGLGLFLSLPRAQKNYS